ncbi:hypothetical protein B4N89_35985 [Embleya scabrispora]|uniref:Uncharacterized protein n=1 Tax=Embleya scabrispora TaxID=159449 RepID=A0A1T3NLQ0_9ACTN|nr:hypothetical protein B4N89_35985 [Embleya scabrispora]
MIRVLGHGRDRVGQTAIENLTQSLLGDVRHLRPFEIPGDLRRGRFGRLAARLRGSRRPRGPPRRHCRERDGAGGDEAGGRQGRDTGGQAAAPVDGPSPAAGCGAEVG